MSTAQRMSRKELIETISRQDATIDRLSGAQFRAELAEARYSSLSSAFDSMRTHNTELQRQIDDKTIDTRLDLAKAVPNDTTTEQLDDLGRWVLTGSFGALETHSVDTMSKVRSAIFSITGHATPTSDIINALQNAGILFRERADAE